jgi:hypothetical protein
MTIGELILKLSDYDPSTLVCYSDKRIVGAYSADNVAPINDEVYPPEEITTRGGNFMCVVLTPGWWS